MKVTGGLDRLTALLALCLIAAPAGYAADDVHGDPLPPFAVARLGTVRWRAPLRDGSGRAQVCFSPDGKVVASVGDCGPCLREVPSGKLAAWPPAVRGAAAAVFSPDGKVLLTKSAGESRRDPRDPSKAPRLLQRWEVGTGKLLSKADYNRTPDSLSVVVFSADGRLLVSSDGEKKVSIRDAQSGRELHEIDYDLQYGGLSLAANGERLALGDNKGAIRLYDTASGKQLQQFLPEADAPLWRRYFGPALSPDGNTLIARAGDRFRVWDATTGRVLRDVETGWGSLAFSPDGKLLASGSRDTTVLLWDVPAARKQHLWEELAEKDRDEAVLRLAAEPDRATAFLRDRLAAAAAGAEAARKLIPDLDADDFAVRERATAALERLPAEAGFALRLALEGDPSLEARKRLEVVLKRREEQTGEARAFDQARLRVALRLLETADRPDARAALEELAKGPAETFVTREARAALARLKEQRRSP